MGAGDLWLLIGNSRWHWAEALAETAAEPGTAALHFSHGPPPDLAVVPWNRLRAWAAVGPLPIQGQEGSRRLEQLESRRLRLERVPLQQIPPWLGIDRALVGWQAWRCQVQRGEGPCWWPMRARPSASPGSGRRATSREGGFSLE